MNVPVWVWWLTIGVTVAVFVVDVLIVGRRPHEPSRRELTLALSTFIGAACCSGSGSGTSPAAATPRSSTPAG